MVTSRQTALGTIKAGDIFHAETPAGTSIVCLAVVVTATVIRARDVCRQEKLDFDRRTGTAPWPLGDQGTLCMIDSVAPLPQEHHTALVGLDRKYNSGRDLSDEEAKLSEAERSALSFICDHYPANRMTEL
jgi:hypothetical protein